MTNAKQIIVPVIISLIAWISISYAFTDSPEILIEKQNKKAIKECLNAIDYQSSSNQILRATTICSELKMKEITNTNKLINAKATTGSVIPVPPSSFNEINLWSNLEKLHDTICKKQINSPLCKDKELFGRLYRITEERLPNKQFYPILIGMTNAESSLWLDFARDKVWGKCVGRNNWGGAKYRINDDNTRTYKRNINWFDYKYPRDQYDCNLFPFESVDEYWISKVNWIRYGYKGCIDSETPIKCISYAYVWNRNVSEQSWVNNVSIFLNK